MSVVLPPPAAVQHPGLSEALALFRALSENPKETKDHLAKLQESLDRYDKQLKAYGTVQEIERLRDDAEKQLTEAENARVQAAQAIEAARAEADAVRKEAEAFRDQVADKAKAITAELKAREDKIAETRSQLSQDQNSFETNMTSRLAECEAREKLTREKLAEVERSHAAVNEQIETLRKAGIKVTL